MTLASICLRVKRSALLPLLALSLVCCSDCLASPVSNEGTLLGMVVASVDGDPITSDDLKKFMALQGSATLDISGGDARVRKLLRDLIVERLIEKEAQGLNIAISDDEISQYVREVQAQNRVDDAGFKTLLKEQGISFDDYRQEVKQEIVRARVVASRVRSKINVVDEDIDRFLKEHPDRIPGGNKVHVQQITFRSLETDSGDRETLRAEVEAIRVRILNGEKFSVVGGENYLDLGFVSIDDLKPALQAAAAGLDVDQVSAVVDDGTGLSLLRIAEKSEEGVASKGIREEIRKELFEQFLTSALEKFLNDDLPAKYSVEIKL